MEGAGQRLNKHCSWTCDSYLSTVCRGAATCPDGPGKYTTTLFLTWHNFSDDFLQHEKGQTICRKLLNPYLSLKGRTTFISSLGIRIWPVHCLCAAQKIRSGFHKYCYGTSLPMESAYLLMPHICHQSRKNTFPSRENNQQFIPFFISGVQILILSQVSGAK